jgi:asparagine synthase (glutamine-hydrolysing)
MADALEDTVWHGEKPIFNANTAAKFLLSKAVRDAGIKVVFTGEGSDEMLAGYPSERRDNILFGGDHADDAARQASINSLIATNPLTKSLFFPVEPPAPGTRLLAAAIGHCPSWIEGMSRMYVAATDVMRSDYPGGGDLDAPYRQLVEELEIPRAFAGRDAVNCGLLSWQHTLLVNFILTVLGDRMEMAHSVEGRVPFLDHHVAEYAARLPIHFKIRETTEKYVLREATREVITPELYARQKHPFMAPPAARSHGVADPLRQACEDVIRSRAFDDQPFFDPAKARALLDRMAANDAPTNVAESGHLLRLATFSLMQQRFGISA